LSNLLYLHLANNQIEVIPDVIGQLSNLRELYFCYNRIKVIPKALEQLSHLERLYLNNNEITEEKPEALRRLRNGIELQLHGQRL